jgi:putative ABC transport system ATP-binding protein
LSSTVSLSNVSKSYHEGESRREVLRNLDFQASQGETVALLGASGSGKSTLLNVLSGLSLPDSGSVVVAGTSLGDLDEEGRTVFRRSSIGLVFQFFHLVPTLTVEENLRLPLQLNGMDTSAEIARAHDLLSRVGLRDRAGQLPDRLSGGEQQRVAVCRALLHRPPLLLADEPTGNLDERAAEQVLDLLFELNRESGSTMLLVTHSRRVAARCQRVERLEAGRLESDTRP